MGDASQGERQPANNILITAKFIAVGAYTTLAKHFPSVNKIEPEERDFFATAAGVALAIELTPNEPPLIQTIQRQVEEWDPNGLRAVLDCVAFVRRATQAALGRGEKPARHVVEGALGIWLVRNATAGAALDDPALALAAGRFVAAALTGVPADEEPA